MKLTFLGTRGYIDERTPLHYMHTSLLVSYKRKSVMLDCGEDWAGKFSDLAAAAIVLTHAHPDHSGGLTGGAEAPVYATEQTWKALKKERFPEGHLVSLRRPCEIAGIHFEAFPVEHSILAPAVGYRISAGGAKIFYVPDVVYIPERAQALANIQIYIGDGATLTRSFVRKRGETLIGHAPVRTQLTWCQKEGVGRAIITHCGSEIVGADPELIDQKLSSMAAERGIQAQIACDGLELVLR